MFDCHYFLMYPVREPQPTRWPGFLPAAGVVGLSAPMVGMSNDGQGQPSHLLPGCPLTRFPGILCLSVKGLTIPCVHPGAWGWIDLFSWKDHGASGWILLFFYWLSRLAQPSPGS